VSASPYPYPCLALASNNPRNGFPDGWIRALKVYTASEHLEPCLELHGPVSDSDDEPDGVPGHIDRQDFRVVFDRCGAFAIKGYSTWVGNWCWDEVAMVPSTLADLLTRLQRDASWTLEAGWADFANRWERGEAITAEMLAA
jgi:hypothetical protein